MRCHVVSWAAARPHAICHEMSCSAYAGRISCVLFEHGLRAFHPASPVPRFRHGPVLSIRLRFVLPAARLPRRRDPDSRVSRAGGGAYRGGAARAPDCARETQGAPLPCVSQGFFRRRGRKRLPDTASRILFFLYSSDAASKYKPFSRKNPVFTHEAGFSGNYTGFRAHPRPPRRPDDRGESAFGESRRTTNGDISRRARLWHIGTRTFLDEGPDGPP